MFEEGQKRHVKSVFSKIVSPDVVNELLQAEEAFARRRAAEVTVWFADVRGFTEFTDQSQEKVVEYIRANHLSGAEAEAAINEEARETLNTVNLYLCSSPTSIKKHNGTLDKYIGDCVMAFWDAPTPNPKHAAACVRAAIDAQRAIYDINRKRAAENHKRELENVHAPRPALRAKTANCRSCTLGSGINTGMATVGLMGSDEHLFNYTVFGREVNLASRLEARFRPRPHHHQRGDLRTFAAGRPGTGGDLRRAAAGEGQRHRRRVKIYEVPWRPPGASPFDEELFSAKPAEGTSFTGIIQRESRKVFSFQSSVFRL